MGLCPGWEGSRALAELGGRCGKGVTLQVSVTFLDPTIQAWVSSRLDSLP